MGDAFAARIKAKSASRLQTFDGPGLCHAGLADVEATSAKGREWSDSALRQAPVGKRLSFGIVAALGGWRYLWRSSRT